MVNERNYPMDTVIPIEVEGPDVCIGRTRLTQNFSTRSDMKARLTIAVCSLFLALTVASAQTPPSDPSLTETPVFQKDCAKCHGKTAEGRHFGGPSLISEKTTATTADELRDIITNGKHHMPKYAGKLTPEEINTLVQQIKAPSKK
jgi:mono/diheme cytochrome c family protein